MEITVDTKQLTGFLNDFEQRQVPYALSNALNDIAKLDQYMERVHIHQLFTVRRKQWVDNSVKITKFATKKDLTATVAIESPGGGARSDILGKFESQTSKRPISGTSLAIPVEAKRNQADIVSQANRPRAFKFKQIGGAGMAKSTRGMTRRMASGVLRGALQVFVGDRRTVMIRNQQGHGVILQRTGRGRKHEGLKLLFRLSPKAKITPNLKFVQTAHEAAKHFGEFFAVRFREAMSTARR